jgi:hypothetical protein
MTLMALIPSKCSCQKITSKPFFSYKRLCKNRCGISAITESLSRSVGMHLLTLYPNILLLHKLIVLY